MSADDNEPNEKKPVPAPQDLPPESQQSQQNPEGTDVETGLSAYLRQAQGSPYLATKIRGDSVAERATIHGDVITRPIIKFLGDNKDRPTFEQLTAELPADISVQFPPSPADLRTWLTTLDSERLIILSSHDPAVVISAGNALVNAPAFQNAQRRMLSFNAGDKRADIAFESLLQAPKTTASSIVLVDGQYPEAELFMLTILRFLKLAQARNNLRSSQRHLVVLTTESQLAGRGGFEPKRDRHIPYRYVDYLKPLLEAAYGHADPDLLRRIERIRDTGDAWGATSDAFYQTFSNFLSRKCLLEEIEKVENRPLSTPADAPETRKIEFLVPQPKNRLASTALFVATFFEGLSVEEFQRVMLNLLADRTEPTPSTQQNPVHKPAGVEAAGSPVGKETPPPERPLRELWLDEHVGILESCRLEIFRAPAGARARRSRVDFLSPTDRDVCQEIFLGRYRILHLDCFRRACEAGLLFDRSDLISTGMIGLILIMADEDPEVYGHAWLMDMLYFAGPAPGAKVVVDGGGIRTIFVNLDNPRRVLIMNRLVRLATRMIETEGLETIVEGFLNQLIEHTLFAQALEMTQRLQYVAGFAPMYWLRQLLDRGDAEARAEVALAIFHLLGPRLERGETGALLQIATWLPPQNASTQRPSSLFALKMIIDVCGTFTFSARWQKPIVWPPEDPLLRALASQENATDRTLISWLFHRGNDELLRARLEDHLMLLTTTWLIPPEVRYHLATEGSGLESHLRAMWDQLLEELFPRMNDLSLDRGHFLFQAVVLADWAILLGGEGSNLPAQAVLTFNRLISAVREHLDREQHQIVCRYLALLEMSLAETAKCLGEAGADLGRTGPRPRELRARLLTESRSIRQLRLGMTAGHAVALQS